MLDLIEIEILSIYNSTAISFTLSPCVAGNVLNPKLLALTASICVMEPLIFAARVILLRFLRLLMTITIEASVYGRSLNISPKQGVESALMINMFAEISGVIFFSFLQSLIPMDIFRHLIIYLILQNLDVVSIDIFILTLFYFVVFLITKWIGLLVLNMFVFDEKIEIYSEGTIENPGVKSMNQWGGLFKTVTKAHTISYAVMLIFVFLKIRIYGL